MVATKYAKTCQIAMGMGDDAKKMIAAALLIFDMSFFSKKCFSIFRIKKNTYGFLSLVRINENTYRLLKQLNKQLNKNGI